MTQWFAAMVFDPNLTRTAKLVCAGRVSHMSSMLVTELELLQVGGAAAKYLLDEIRGLEFYTDVYIEEKQDEEVIPLAEARPPVTKWQELAIWDLEFKPPGLQLSIDTLCDKVEVMFMKLEMPRKMQYFRNLDVASDLLLELGQLLHWPAAGLTGIRFQQILGAAYTTAWMIEV